MWDLPVMAVSTEQSLLSAMQKIYHARTNHTRTSFAWLSTDNLAGHSQSHVLYMLWCDTDRDEVHALTR